MSNLEGIFITFEGSEGAGKSTQMKLLQEYLVGRNKDVNVLREPGGVKISEDIRNILLSPKNKDMSKECETFLYMASRSQLVEERLLPMLRRGGIVLCDRFLDSTRVYQGYGCGVDLKTIEDMGVFATQNIVPDLTFFLDMPVEKSMARINHRTLDRIEQRDLDYHNRVRNGYLELVKNESERIKCIEVDQSIEDIHTIVKNYTNQLLDDKDIERNSNN